MSDKIPEISGAQELAAWFGYWPSFHDAEVLELRLDRRNESLIRIHTWHVTNEIDAKGFYVTNKDVIVTISLKSVKGVALSGFNFQNVIAGLDIIKNPTEYVITLSQCYGLSGDILAEHVSISLQRRNGALRFWNS